MNVAGAIVVMVLFTLHTMCRRNAEGIQSLGTEPKCELNQAALQADAHHDVGNSGSYQLCHKRLDEGIEYIKWLRRC